MTIIVKDTGGGDFTPVPQGTHLAACFLLADIGLQQSQWGVKHKIVIGFELPDERIEIEGEDKPMIIYKTYTSSLSEKANLRHDLEGWRGRAFTPEELEGFDLHAILGKPCMVTVTHNTVGDKVYANVASVSSLPKGLEPKPATRQIFYDGTGSMEELPKWIQNKLSGVGQEVKDTDKTDPAFDDDIPFNMEEA